MTQEVALKLVFDEDPTTSSAPRLVSRAAAELIQFCALAVRSATSAAAVAAQLSVHPGHAERLIKSFGVACARCARSDERACE